AQGIRSAARENATQRKVSTIPNRLPTRCAAFAAVGGFLSPCCFKTRPAFALDGACRWRVRGANPPMPRCAGHAGLLRQPLPDPNEGCRHRRGVVPFTLAIAIGEIEGQRRRVGVDDDFDPAEGARGWFCEPEQNVAVALALEVAADGDEAKTCLGGADEVDAHRAYDLAVADEHVRKMAALEFIRVVLVIGFARQQGGEEAVPAAWVVMLPL